MKKNDNDDTRKMKFTVRVNDAEHTYITKKADELGLSVSELMRKATMDVPIQPIVNGGDVAHSIRQINMDLRNCQNSLTNDITELRNAVEKNSHLLEKYADNQSKEIFDIFKLQNEHIRTIADVVQYKSSQMCNSVPEKLNEVYKRFIR